MLSFFGCKAITDLSIALFVVLCFRVVPTAVEIKVTVCLTAIITNEIHSCVINIQKYHYYGRTSACPHILQHFSENPDATQLTIVLLSNICQQYSVSRLSFYVIHLTQTYIKCSNAVITFLSNVFCHSSRVYFVFRLF